MCSIAPWSDSAYCWRRVQADTDPMSVNCWASLASAGQYPFSPSQYVIVADVCPHSIHCPNAVKMLASVIHMARHRTNARYTNTLPMCLRSIYQHDASNQS